MNGKINNVLQDLVRELWNHFTNVFYTANEEKKLADVSYQPLVSVTTKTINDNIKIIVKDNGNGIPKLIIDKISLPFFSSNQPAKALVWV